MTTEEAVETIRTFAADLFDDKQSDQKQRDQMTEAARTLIQLGPVDAIDILYAFEQEELVALTMWYMQAAAERGFGTRAGGKRRTRR